MMRSINRKKIRTKKK